MFGEKGEEASFKAPPNASQSLLLQASGRCVGEAGSVWISIPPTVEDNRLSND